ncbi:hypothetical protein JYG23_01845 [Sedimentibacter sp. zth1]|uniref:hypothetical protein n=1 Tax=Sedimentibacter sp. zth1 TaxID=2816908 RepID=UPI001A9112BF|nr:hypothetical protein [Sedimentibacter sp. zth1]QSX06229.1 hypothetical protein JYG23_01845 [Sedimentibacter sp. zth1]
MKKKITLIIIAIFLVTSLMILFNLNKNKQILQISVNSRIGVISIKNKETIKNINNIISNIKYTNEKLISNLSTYNENFLCKIRLENNKNIVYNIVFFCDTKNDVLIIHNADSKLKYGYLDSTYKNKLLDLLKENEISIKNSID